VRFPPIGGNRRRAFCFETGKLKPFGGPMTGKQFGNRKNELRVELKYCERCGVLWLRDPSTAQVYCEHCRPRMDELPVQKKQGGSVRLRCGKRAIVENYKLDVCEMNAMPTPSARGVA
jgi:hypothetical protein